MSHVREQVRDAVATILKRSIKGKWTHVYQTRIKPAHDTRPFLLVYVDSESSEPLTIHPTPIIERTMLVSIRGFLAITDDQKIEKQMDDMAAEIECCLVHDAMDTELSTKVGVWFLINSTMTIEEEEERIDAQLALDYTLTVSTAEADPQTLM